MLELRFENHNDMNRSYFVGQVVSQDKRCCEFFGSCNQFQASNGFKLISERFPEYNKRYPQELYVRGSEPELDNKSFIVNDSETVKCLLDACTEYNVAIRIEPKTLKQELKELMIRFDNDIYYNKCKAGLTTELDRLINDCYNCFVKNVRELISE